MGEAHTNLKDGGIPVGRLEMRSVTIHMISFSPANMMLRVTGTTEKVVSFFTVAIASKAEAGTRVCITFHALPTDVAGAKALQECASAVASSGAHKDIKACSQALGEALEGLDFAGAAAVKRGLAAFVSAISKRDKVDHSKQ